MALTDEQRLGFLLTNTVKQWAKITIKELRQSLKNKNVGKTGDLYRSFRYVIFSDSDGVPTRVTIGFDYHGKFVDMGVGNGMKIENQKTNREIWRNMSRTEKRGYNIRRPKKWYSPTMYKEYQRLAEILTGKYKIEIPARFEKLYSEGLQNLEIKV